MDIYAKEPTKKIFRIEDGPSRDKLIDALKYAYDKEASLPVSFKVMYGGAEMAGCSFDFGDLSLVRVGHEDGSGHSFNLDGYCSVWIEGKLLRSQFWAYYNSNTRKGNFEFKDQKVQKVLCQIK